MLKRLLSVTLLAVLCAAGCGKPVPAGKFLSLASFEPGCYSLEFRPGNQSMDLCTDINPKPDAVNPTKVCMRYVAGGGHSEFIWSRPWDRHFDFTANPAIFRMKVLAPAHGLRVNMTLEPKDLSGPVRPVTVRGVVTRCEGRWEDMVFDFTPLAPESNVYSKIVINFNAGRSGADQVWYFDEIEGPDDCLQGISLMRPYAGNPVFRPEGSFNWRDSHIANTGILTPEESPTGLWMLYARGSGYIPDYHDQIGLFTQDPADFHPFGPWKEYEGNPVIQYTEGGWDEFLLLDTAPLVGPDGTLYIYYKGRNKQLSSNIGVAWSTDGGYTFQKPGKPWLSQRSGTCSAMYHDGKYCLVCGTRIYASDDPLNGDNSEIIPCLWKGGAPSHMDDYALWGTFIWRLKDVDKWFISYQGSSCKPDFPDRFHVAYSDDLVHWTKVQNPQPFYGRGPAGAWDQGGIWCPDVFEYKDSLYMYYEGWGIDKVIYNRNQDYFEGHSSVGAASCSKADFLRWCGLAD